MRIEVDEGDECSYFVLVESEEKKGDRWLRLGDLVYALQWLAGFQHHHP